MKKQLSFQESISIVSMLFGMFFGAGNLIFPVHLGQIAGRNLWPAFFGFVITGVGLPMLGVASFGITGSNGLHELAGKIGKKYAVFFTVLLYLTIGPFFAIPRCATTAFTVGLEPIFSSNKIALLIFSLLFFAVVMFFSLKPKGIMTWIGRMINPVFLAFYFVLIIVSLLNPSAAISSVEPDAAYETGAFANGFLEGYNTMDAIASLAFGIVVVNVLRGLGVTESKDITKNTIFTGVFACLAMGVIYLGTVIMGAQSRGLFETSANGGIALAELSGHYLGAFGEAFLAILVTLACLKTAIGLVTSLCEAFDGMFTKGEHYKAWAIGFCVFSFGVANFGLNTIITYAVPVLMFIYPLVITLILLSIFGGAFDYDPIVYRCVTVFTLIAAVFDFFNSLGVEAIANIGKAILPFFSLGFGWLVPALIGLVLGLILRGVNKNKAAAA